MPIFNKEKYLIRSISSIQSQSLKNIEIVAINDGSTDKTLKILKKLSKKDFRIKIVNNDRNHGLLYSRAIGIINSRGEYLMNLDPDDRLNANNNLLILYNKAKILNLDYIMFLIKRIPINKTEIEISNIIDKLQLQMEDFLITNKFIKKEILLKAFNYLSKEVYGCKWNYHEDNIWNLLTRKYATKKKVLNKFIYVYEKNNESLNNAKYNFIDIKNRIYRIKILMKINSDNKYDSYRYYYKYYLSIQYIIKNYNSSLIKDNEIKKQIINICFNLLNIFYDSIEISKSINYIINLISDNKIIILYSSNSNTSFNYLNILIILKTLLKNNSRKLLFVNVNNKIQFNNIINYIYFNDILVGLDDIYNHKIFEIILSKYISNKIILFIKNISYPNPIYINITKNNMTNLVIYSLNKNLNFILKNFFLRKIIFIPGFLSKASNYFNYKKKCKKHNIINIYDNYEYMKYIKNISYSLNLNNISYIFRNNTTNLIDIIKDSKLILTDDIYITELSALYFTSCILYEKNKGSKIKYKYIFELNYIKRIENIKLLEKEIRNIRNLKKNFSYYNKQKNYYKQLFLIKKEFIK